MRQSSMAILITCLAAVCPAATVAQEASGQVPARIEAFVTVRDGTRLFFTRGGSGSDVLVVPVGFYLEPQLFDALSEHRRVVFYDPRNRGRSRRADLSTVSLDRQVQDLEDLRQALGIRQMALLGWSGLGMEMAVYALRYPNRVTRLIQMAAVPPAASVMRDAGGDARNQRVDEAAIDALVARAEAGAFDDAGDEYCRQYNALLAPSNFADPAFIDQVPDVCVYENEWPENLWPYFGALLPSFGDYDWRDDLGRLDIPRLVIHGREDGIPLAGAEAWVSGYENARLLVVSPAGHFPHIEQRDIVIDAINTFLDGEWPTGAVTLDSAYE